jgi:hypothetical protein
LRSIAALPQEFAAMTSPPYPQGTFRVGCVTSEAESIPAFRHECVPRPACVRNSGLASRAPRNPASRSPSVVGVRPPTNEHQVTPPSACATARVIRARSEKADPERDRPTMSLIAILSRNSCPTLAAYLELPPCHGFSLAGGVHASLNRQLGNAVARPCSSASLPVRGNESNETPPQFLQGLVNNTNDFEIKNSNHA